MSTSKPDLNGLVSKIDSVLPQTQCTRCGYPSCIEYARAIAHHDERINRCPPGGAAGITALAALVDQAATPLDPECGEEGPRRIAYIDAKACIGCTKCIRACPVDAIIGGPKGMHTVLPALCSGCDLCLAPCPVDCIEMDVVELPWSAADRDAARQRFEFRQARLARDKQDDTKRHVKTLTGKLAPSPSDENVADALIPPLAAGDARITQESRPTPAALTPLEARKRKILEAALARAKSRLESTAPAAGERDER